MASRKEGANIFSWYFLNKETVIQQIFFAADNNFDRVIIYYLPHKREQIQHTVEDITQS